MKMLNILRRLWSSRQPNQSPTGRTKNGTRLNLEQLEDRVVPTAYVFVEFGDNFPAVDPATGTRVLPTTVGALRDVAPAQRIGPAVLPNTAIQGPQLTNATGNNYADGTAVNFTRFMNTANQRAQMMAAARAAFASVDV